MFGKVVTGVKKVLHLAPAVLFAPLSFVAPKPYSKVLSVSLQNCGAVYVKFGQWLSARRNGGELKSLQADCRPHEDAYTKFAVEKCLLENGVLQERFGLKFEDGWAAKDKEEDFLLGAVFKSFVAKPVAVGSFGQVSKCVLWNGDVVAVKTLHPGLRENVGLDLALIRSVVGVAERCLPFLRWYCPMNAVDGFEKTLRTHLDLRVERRNLERFARMFRFRGKVALPVPYAELSSRDVLVESFCDGVPLSSVLDGKERKSSAKKKELFDILVDCFYTMVVKNNFFHADMHPGNILVQKDNRLVLLDAGMGSSIPRFETIRHHLNLIAHRKYREAAEFMVDLAPGTRSCTPKQREMFVEEMTKVMEEFGRTALGKLPITKMVGKVMMLAQRCHVELDSSLVDLLLNAGVLSAVGEQLDPSHKF